jgi:hypothetical protein
MELESLILRRMYRRHYIGGKHTDIVHLEKSLPKHVRGEAKKAILNLLREGILLPKRTGYGFHVSLDPERLDEVKAWIGD